MLRIEALLQSLSEFPWRTTASVLRQRFREDRLSLTAGSLTFTTVLALVPFITVALAVFTAFPFFSTMQGLVQRWLVQSLVPDSIARQVLGYLTQFASKASRLGSVGLTVLLVTALALVLTIDRTLNNIWRVRSPRPLMQRLTIYWAVLTLGPVILAVSLVTTSYVVGVSRSLIGTMPGGLRLLLDSLEVLILTAGMALLYRHVPNTHVKWSHAWAGGLFVSLGIEAAKKLLGVYIGAVPTYSMVYGAFATFPILLVWIYVAWVIVLLGAVIAAYLPSLLAGVVRQGGGPGWNFQLAVEILQVLHAVRGTPARGWDTDSLAQGLRVDALQLEPALAALRALDWVGELAESERIGKPRVILLAEPAQTPLAPLAEMLLLGTERSLDGVWQGSRLRSLRLSDVL